MDFSTYTLEGIKDLPGGVADLADGLIWRITAQIEYEGLSVPRPTAQELFGMVRAIAPYKELQRNKPLTQAAVGDGFVSTAGKWLEDSGVLRPLAGSFSAPALVPIPNDIDAIVWSGGVANWELRRMMGTVRFDPQKAGRVILPMGGREMREDEHQFVTTFRRLNGRPPKEYEFGQKFIEPYLTHVAGFSNVEVFPVASGQGDEVLAQLFAQHSSLLNGTILLIGNAPNTQQAAAQLWLAGRAADPAFDEEGHQLFVWGDSIAPALHGETRATNQEVDTGLGALLRNAALLQKVAESI